MLTEVEVAAVKRATNTKDREVISTAVYEVVAQYPHWGTSAREMHVARVFNRSTTWVRMCLKWRELDAQIKAEVLRGAISYTTAINELSWLPLEQQRTIAVEMRKVVDLATAPSVLRKLYEPRVTMAAPPPRYNPFDDTRLSRARRAVAPLCDASVSCLREAIVRTPDNGYALRTELAELRASLQILALSMERICEKLAATTTK